MEIRYVEAIEPKLPTPFVYVLITLSAICILYVVTTYAFTMRARTAAFTDDFMKQFDDEHSVAFEKQPKAPQYGYPDTGNGYFGMKLPYAAWYKMNNGQRCQINFLEQLTFALVSGFLAGISYPIWTASLLTGYFFARLVFAIGYTKGGPNARIAGALVMDLCLLGQIILSCMSCYKLFTK